MSKADNRAVRRQDDQIARRLLQSVAKNRDRQAFGELFDAFAPRVKIFMMRKGAARDLAEDLVQETMILVWTKAGLYDPARGAVSTWVFTIARNLWIDRHRRASLVPLTVLGECDAPSSEPGSDEIVTRKQEERLVAQALEDIPPEQKETLVLSFVDNLAHSEIALRLNLPLGTVKSRVRLAYVRLRKALEALN
jgi:RNA polymerase sigma-70 factor (ECF subfamily)